jgi:autotransporter-associated beta strand protein
MRTKNTRQFSRRNRLSLAGSILFIVGAQFILTIPAFAGSKYWVGASGTTNAPTSGTWQTTTPTVWSDGTIDTANSGWTAGDTAFFGGADGTYGIKLGSAISMVRARFSASGYALTNNSAFTVTATGSPILIVDSGKTATVGTNITVTAAITMSMGADAGGDPGGTLIIENGATVQQTGNVGDTINGAGTIVSVKPGGNLKTSSGSSSPLVIGNTVGDNSTLSVDGGTVSIQRSSSSIWVPAGPGAVAGDIRGTLTLNSGAVTEIGGFVSIGQGSGNLGTVNLNGGTLTTAALIPGGSLGAAGAGTSIVNFNGGTLKAQQAQVNFATGLTAAYVRNGGAVINNNTFAVTIAQALLHTTNLLDNATDGGLTNIGSGTLTLLGANTYNGPTMVGGGKLVTTTASIGLGAYIVTNNSTIEVQVNTPETSLTNSTLTLGVATGGVTNNFTLGGNASAVTPAIRVSGALNLNAAVAVNVSGSLSGPSTNILISYGSITGAGSFVAGSLPSVPGFTGLLVNDVANKQLKLVYLPPSVPVQWAVTSGSWDTTSLNWQPVGGGIQTNYYELSPVTFDDNAPFAATHTMTLTGNRTPTDINVNSTNNYTFAGSFAITAGGALSKSGGGRLTLGVNSAHNGGTTINAGTVQVGVGGTSGSIGSGDILDNGALVFNRSDNLNIAGVISGSGGLTQAGSGTLTLAASNSYSGATLVNTGKLVVLTTSTGGGDYTVADGAVLEVQAADATSSLSMNSITLGASGNLTNNFNLGASRFGFFPAVSVAGDVNLNGTVTVNVSGSGFAAGTYVLLQYSGNLNGSGSFVAGGLPGISTLVNDTGAKQLQLIVNTTGLVWDSGNTTNGPLIDAASGTWDLVPANTVWNNSGVNVAYANGNNAIFAGADGAYAIKVGGAVSPPVVTFVNSGYTLANDAPQTVALSTASTATPKLVVSGGKTVTIGSNVTVNLSSTSFVGNSGDTAGGTISVENGGVLQELTGNSFVLDGAGALLSVKTGGIVRHAGGGGGQFAIGAGNTGNPATLSVDGGSVVISANNCPVNIASGAAGVAGTLTINGGSLAMPTGATASLNIGTQTGDVGTLNLNGGTLSVPRITKGVGAVSTNNFNGGTLVAVNANFGATFLTGLDRANVRNGGVVINDGGFAIEIDQPLEHSDIAGDNANDGGLTKAGVGILTLGGASTYTGPTKIGAGTLLVNGSIAGSAVTVSNGATLGGTGTVAAPVTVATGGSLAPGTGIGTLTFGSDLTLNGNLIVEVDNSAVPSSDLCNVTGALTAGAGIVTVTNIGASPLNLGDSFTLFNKAVSNGAALMVTPAPGAGLAWTNKLAVDGTIAVVSGPTIPSNPTNLTVSVSGNTLNLSWPGNYLGWLVQSNITGVAASNAWHDIPGSDGVTNLSVTISPGVGNAFYRMRHP